MKKYLVITLIALITLNIGMITSYAINYNTKEFNPTREELQQYVESTAKQYYYKNTYTEYEQGQMDNTNNTVKTSTFMFRDFMLEPEQLNQTTIGNFDCSSFVSNVYMNALGYAFIDYYNLTPSYYYYYNSSYKFIKQQSSKNIFRYGLQKTGKGINCTTMDNIVRSKGTYKKGIVYKDDTNTKLVQFYYRHTNNETQSQINNIYEQLESILQDGDIFIIRHEKDGVYSAHSMMYFSGIYNKYKIIKPGFLHSTGKDYSFSDPSRGDDEKSITLIEYYYFKTYQDENKGYMFYTKSDKKQAYSAIVLRPINEVLTGNYTNFYSNKFNDLITSKNTIARNEIKDLRSEEYTEIKDQENYKLISKNQSANINEQIRYTLDLKNESDIESYTIKITDKVPEHTKYINCNDCTYDEDTKTVTWNNVIVEPYENIKLSYEVIIDKQTNHITKQGMQITTENENVLTMAKNSFWVNPTYREKEKTKLLSSIKKAQTALKNGYLTTNNNITTDYYKTNISSITKTNKKTMNTSTVIKMLYYDAFKIELKNIQNYTSAVYIKNKDGYIKRNNDYKDTYSINQMQVPGLYGGTEVRGNLDNLRIRSISFQDLEIGDIIIPSSTKNAYIFLGKNNETNEYEIINGRLTIYKGQSAINILRKVFAYKNFTILRPSKVYSSQLIFDYDDELKENTLTLESINTTYNSLPQNSKSYTVSFNYDDYNNTTLPENLTVINKIENWYNGTTKIIENSSKISNKPYLNLKAVYEKNSITLPFPEKENYAFDGWYTSLESTEKIGNANEKYSLTKNQTLYAKYKENEYGDITINQTTGGEINLSKTTAKKDEEVTITVNLQKNYRLEDINGVEATKINENEYKFIMPNHSIKITPNYKYYPPAPLNLNTKSHGYKTLKLTWDKNEDVDGYAIYKYNNTTKQYKYMISTTNNYIYTSYNLTTGQKAYYKIKAYKIINSVKQYGDLSKNTYGVPLPSAPINVKASKYRSGVAKIKWTKTTGATGYDIYKYNSTTKKYVFITRTTRNYLITSKKLKSGSKAYYKVKAYTTVNKIRYYGETSLKSYVRV